MISTALGMARIRGGIPLPDVYVYLVEAVCENGKTLSKKGSVTVIR